MYKLNKKRERKIDHVLSYVVGIQYLKKEEQEFQINCFNLIMLEMNLNLNSEPPSNNSLESTYFNFM